MDKIEKEVIDLFPEVNKYIYGKELLRCYQQRHTLYMYSYNLLYYHESTFPDIRLVCKPYILRRVEKKYVNHVSLVSQNFKDSEQVLVFQFDRANDGDIVINTIADDPYKPIRDSKDLGKINNCVRDAIKKFNNSCSDEEHLSKHEYSKQYCLELKSNEYDRERLEENYYRDIRVDTKLVVKKEDISKEDKEILSDFRAACGIYNKLAKSLSSIGIFDIAKKNKFKKISDLVRKQSHLIALQFMRRLVISTVKKIADDLNTKRSNLQNELKLVPFFKFSYKKELKNKIKELNTYITNISKFTIKINNLADNNVPTPIVSLIEELKY